MASLSYFLTAVLFVILGLAYAGAQNPHPDLQNFYDGIKAQERILVSIISFVYNYRSVHFTSSYIMTTGKMTSLFLQKLGRYRKMLPNGQYADRTIIPIDEALNCFACSSDVTCTKSCENFYRLVHAIAEVHDEYQKLTAIRDQTADDQDIEVLRIILERLSTQACSLVSIFTYMYVYIALATIACKMEHFFFR